MEAFTPLLCVRERGGGVRLELAGCCHADGPTLQEAGDELVVRMLEIAMAFRTGATGQVSSECRPDPALLRFIWEIGVIAASGGDIRDRLFGADTPPA
jgi:hypothetical protein